MDITQTPLKEWKSPLDLPRKIHGQKIAHELAKRLLDHTTLQEAISRSEQTDKFFHWGDYGHIGLSLMVGYLDLAFPAQGFDVIAYNQLLKSSQNPRIPDQSDISLTAGLSGLGFAADKLSKGKTRYQNYLSIMDGLVVSGALKLVEHVRSHPGECGVRDYDIVSGLSGIAAYLLTRKDQIGPLHALKKILECLVWMSESNLAGFITSVKQMQRFDDPATYQYGFVNVGLAHGIPGPLAILSLAYSEGVIVSEMDLAIRRIANWLLAIATKDEWGINWPSLVPLDQHQNPGPSFENARTGWCYGNPGIASSLWLASEALDCSVYRSSALEALKSAIRRPLSIRMTVSSSFCHGIAGILQIVLRFYNATKDEEFAIAAAKLFDQLVSSYNENKLLGFQNIESGEVPVDNPALFSGATGIALTLLSATSDVEPSWDRIFMLS